MPRFTVDHIVDEFVVADCGFNPFCGFFVEVFDVRRHRPHLIYDRMQPGYDHERPLLGALIFLDHYGFLVCLDEALMAMTAPIEEDLPSAVARTVEIIAMFKRAAD